MKNFFKSQVGAMFSMDARIALVVGSILAGTIGVQVVQKIQRDRLELAEASALELIKALDNYAIDTPNGPLPGSQTATTFSTGLNNFVELVLEGGYAQNAALNVDPWGNGWVWDSCTTNLTIEGVLVSVYYAVVYSGGPDGIPESHVSANFLQDSTCQVDYGEWLPQGDDIGAKYTNLELQRARVLEYKRRAQAVISALQAYESQRFIENQRFCSNSSNHSNSRCNWDTSTGSSGYETGEEARMNYYPRSGLDTLATTTSPNDFYAGMNGVPGVDGSSTSIWVPMEAAFPPAYTTLSLLSEIGLPDEYETDPWGRRLCYHSNAGRSTNAPFLATVRYTNSCS